MTNSLVPEFIDGTNVIKWAWSGQKPFGYVGNIDDSESEEVYGLAICQYEDNDSVYRFSCDKNWEAVQDGLYDTVETQLNNFQTNIKM
jgi:hypothetical protein